MSPEVAAYDVYGGWQPTTLDEQLECELDPYITEAVIDVPAELVQRPIAVEAADAEQ